MRRRLVGVAGIVLVAALTASTGYAADAPVREQWSVGATVVKDSPLGRRRAPAIAVRGSRVFVIGGEKVHRDDGPARRMNDGAVYDLRSKEWTRLPDAPFQRTSVSAAQWVGRNLVVAGVTCPGPVGQEHGCTGGRTVVAVYSARSESWRRLKVPARLPSGFGSRLTRLMATREEAWFVDGGINTVTVNPRTGKWRDIPPALLGSTGSTCATKRYAATLGGIRPMGPAGVRILTVEADDWGSLVDPAGFPDAVEGGSPSCNADSVVVVRASRLAQATCPAGAGCTPVQTSGPVPLVRRYDLAAKRWSVLTAPPAMPGSTGIGHGGVIDFLVGGGPGLRLTTATGEWTPIAPAPDLASTEADLVWARGLVVTHDVTIERDRLVVYRPE